MLLSFQRPDAKKARPPRLHDPATLRKRRAAARGEIRRRARELRSSARAKADPSREIRRLRAVSDAPAAGVECPRVRAGPRPTHAGHGSHASSPTAASVPVRPAAGDASPPAAAQDAARDRRPGLARAGPGLALLRLHDGAGAGSAAVRGRAAGAAVERRDLRRRRQDRARRAALRPVPRARALEGDRAR